MPDEQTPPVNTRWSLLSRMKRNEDEAWEEFCRIYVPLIRAYARSRGAAETHVEDVCQDVLTEVHRDLPGLIQGSRNGSFTAWLRQKIRWRVEDRRRAERRHEGSVVIGSGEDDLAPSRIEDPGAIDAEREFDLNLARQIDAEVLRRLAKLRSVKPPMYQAWHWKRRDGWESARIARALDVSKVATIDTWVFRVQKHYDAELARIRKCWE